MPARATAQLRQAIDDFVAAYQNDSAYDEIIKDLHALTGRLDGAEKATQEPDTPGRQAAKDAAAKATDQAQSDSSQSPSDQGPPDEGNRDQGLDPGAQDQQAIKDSMKRPKRRF